MKVRFRLFALLMLALSVRLLFVNQAFQLDDAYYLAGARYVQTDPAHPWRAGYVFLGERVDMRGHPHPPFDVWFLGLVLLLTGTAREAPLHLVYAVFTLVAVAAMFHLARRFTRRPYLATLLFLAIPAFVVHGNGLESDIPFVALWMAAAAAFICAVDALNPRLLALAGVLLALASLAAYQAILLAPVLAFYAWTRKRNWRPALAVSAIPLVVFAGYQLYQRIGDGALPVSVLMGHFQRYGLQSLHNKARNALALTAHLAWVLFPALSLAAFAKLGRKLWAVAAAATAAAVFIDRSPLFWASFGLGAVILLWCVRRLRAPDDPDSAFLKIWIVVFFAGALAIFFAGAARYLLPIGPPLAILAVRALERRPRWLLAGFAVQLLFGLALACSHYQHSAAYRDFVRSLEPRFTGHRVWINGEWGLQYYGQQAGAQPLLRGEELKPGDWVISSQLGYPVSFTAPGTRPEVAAAIAVRPTLPLRLIALNARSAFSTISFGVRPFDITRAPADLLTAEVFEQRLPTRESLPMNAPEAAGQIVSGIYGLENNAWRWTADRAVLLLKRPEGPAAVQVRFSIPGQAAARRVTLSLDDAVIAERTFPGPGAYTLESGVLPSKTGPATLAIAVDRTFTAPGDQRRLGVILSEAGFVPPPQGRR